MSDTGEVVLPRVKLSSATVIDVEVYPPKKSSQEVVTIARNAFRSNRTKKLEFRIKQLKNLSKFLKDNKDAICEALYKDLRKGRHEATILEIANVQADIRYTLAHLEDWVKPSRPPKGPLTFFDSLYIYKDPYGVVLVMGAWNYPLHLTLSPVVGAIAAGNTVIIKPSDVAPATSHLMYNLLPQYLDKDCYIVFEGGVEETTSLLQERFDYIFYTGSTSVGRVVQAAASKHLTPTTLEMGGKSPTYIDNSVNMEIAARRILWGKLTNAGQTCIAPDYILCTKQVQEAFVHVAEKIIKEMFSGNAKTSKDYGRIVSPRHFKRINELLSNQKIAYGGNIDPDDLYIHPTILVDVSPNDDIMQEEIFGPILPIINVADENEAISFINQREKPLALYIFSKKRRVRDLFLLNTSCGGVCVNDTIMHCTVPTLPFGGVGNSGMGSYHGKKSFDTFTHEKSVLVKDYNRITEKAQSVRYPPYTKSNTAAMERLISINGDFNFKFIPYLVVFALGVGVTVGAYFLNKVYDENYK